MTNPTHPREVAKRARRVALGPVISHVDQVRTDVQRLADEIAALAAAVEQQQAVISRLEAYVDQSVDEVHGEAELLRQRTEAMDSLLDELGITGAPQLAGQAIRDRVQDAVRQAEALGSQVRRDLGGQIGELRASTRLTQSLVERALATTAPVPATAPTSDDADEAAPPGPVLPTTSPVGAPATSATGITRRFDHPVPTFDLLYRAFEDRHRGSLEEITDRQRADYLELLSGLPNPELPIADLGCGRGELVHLLTDHGQRAVGVDVNTGQVVDDDEGVLVEDDLFSWLDRQADRSMRAVTSAHVIEHLPTDLQIRLVFEAYRVLAPGGVLVLETPNALSISTAATNFWVDPTHERPVHPLFMEFLAREAGFTDTERLPVHPVALAFRTTGAEVALVDDLNSLIFGHGDLALLAWR